MSTFASLNDHFSIDSVPPRPLSLDWVFEDRKPASEAGSRLFQLPLEILAQITQQVPVSSLASPALVYSDCQKACNLNLNYRLRAI